MRDALGWIVVVAVLVVGGFLLLGNRQPAPQPGDGVGGGPGVLVEQKRMEVNLDPVNQDQIDQSGRATFEERNGRVTVTINVNQVEGLNNQPAHIHEGFCPGVGGIVFPLNNVIDGRSVTEIDTTIDQIQDIENPKALNIHKSPEEISVYTTCGELSQ